MEIPKVPENLHMVVRIEGMQAVEDAIDTLKQSLSNLDIKVLWRNTDD